MLAGKAKPRGCEKKLADRKAKIKLDWVSAKGSFKHMICRCRPGRLSQEDLKKELANRKAKIKMDGVLAKRPLAKYNRGMLAGKAKPRGPEKEK